MFYNSFLLGFNKPLKAINHHQNEEVRVNKAHNTHSERWLINFHTRVVYGRLKSLHGASKKGQIFVNGAEWFGFS